jgi:hypothetical protein
MSKICKRVGRLDDQDGHYQRRGQRFSAPWAFCAQVGKTSPAKVAGNET